MSTPIAFSDLQLSIVFAAAAPLQLGDRDRFLRDVAAELAAHQVHPVRA